MICAIDASRYGHGTRYRDDWCRCDLSIHAVVLHCMRAVQWVITTTRRNDCTFQLCIFCQEYGARRAGDRHDCMNGMQYLPTVMVAPSNISYLLRPLNQRPPGLDSQLGWDSEKARASRMQVPLFDLKFLIELGATVVGNCKSGGATNCSQYAHAVPRSTRSARSRAEAGPRWNRRHRGCRPCRRRHPT